MTQKYKKTETQSLARFLSEESSAELAQMKEIRNAAYKSGFAMAASIIRGYLREVERGEPISVRKLITWTEECQHWRRNNSLDDVPKIP